MPLQTVSSKLTKKYQATIPEPVRRLLHLESGDTIAFDMDGDEIRLRKARPLDQAFAESLQDTLSEWASPADEDAYRDL